MIEAAQAHCKCAKKKKHSFLSHKSGQWALFPSEMYLIALNWFRLEDGLGLFLDRICWRG